MSYTRLTTDQYEDKSVTSAKLADNITIAGTLTANSITTDTDPFSLYNSAGTTEHKLQLGELLTLNGSTLGSTNGLLYKVASDNFASPVDVFHVDRDGNVYIKGNLSIAGTMDSVTTTVNTMEVADYEIILNASVTSPYASGARLTVNRGSTNFDPYIGWNETSDYWELYDGTNTARVIDQTYGDGRYVSLAGDTMTDTLTISGVSAESLKLKAGATTDHVYIGLYADSQAQTTRSGWMGYGSGGNTTFGITNEMANGSISLTSNGTGKVTTNSDLSVGGDVTVTGNKLSFGNGSYISNETDTALEVKGDGSVYVYADGATVNRFVVSSTAINTFNSTEAYVRWLVQFADGKMGWGPGTATRDTWLYRDAANSLKTDGALNVTGKVNNVTITAPATGSTLTIADGKTLTCNHSITLSGTDGKVLSVGNSMTLFADNDTSTLNIGAGGTLGTAAFTDSTAYLPIGGGTLTGDLTVTTKLVNANVSVSSGIATVAGQYTSGSSVHTQFESFNRSAWNQEYVIKLSQSATACTLVEAFRLRSDVSNAYIYGNAAWHAGNLTFGTGNSNMSRGDHVHANLIAGNGITGTTYTGGAAQTWSIASHAGTAGSVGTITVTADAVGVSLGTTSTTACAGNDSRLSNSRTPVEHGDSLHNNNKYARITFTGGTSNVGYQWNHALNSANVIFSFAPNSPEPHVYYTIVDNNNVKIYLDDAPYEDIVVDVVATLADATHLTTATANLTA